MLFFKRLSHQLPNPLWRIITECGFPHTSLTKNLQGLFLIRAIFQKTDKLQSEPSHPKFSHTNAVCPHFRYTSDYSVHHFEVKETAAYPGAHPQGANQPFIVFEDE